MSRHSKSYSDPSPLTRSFFGGVPGGGDGRDKPPAVSLGGKSLAGAESFTWALVAGVQPYTTSIEVPNRLAPGIDELMSKQTEEGYTLKIRGLEFKQVFIHHKQPTSSPRRTRYLISDRRWRWRYRLFSRDYNVPKRTGNRQILSNVPIRGAITADQYDYRWYSIPMGEERWKPLTMLKDWLEVVIGAEDTGDGDGKDGGKGKGGTKKADPGKGGDGGKGKGSDPAGALATGDGWRIESLPIKTSVTGVVGKFSIQGLITNDPADVALARILQAIPGAMCYINMAGEVVIFDGNDQERTQELLKSLPPSTRRGEKHEHISKRIIRPKGVKVFYQREMEILCKFEDDWTGTTGANQDPKFAWLDNVIPTVDQVTTVTDYYDWQKGETIAKVDVPAGVYLPAKQWLAAMEAKRKDAGVASMPWNFETIQKFWMLDLEGALGAQGDYDIDTTGSIPLRVAALKQHFRQTFRLQRRYVDRMRDFQATRVALLDPITGTKNPAMAWGRMTIIPSQKGMLVSPRSGAGKDGIFRQLDTIRSDGSRLWRMTPLPLTMSMVDADQGIFRADFVSHPAGTDAGHVMSTLTFSPTSDSSGSGKASPTRKLSHINKGARPAGFGFTVGVEKGTNAMMLAQKAKLWFIMTIVPGAPNSKARYHVEDVTPEKLAEIFGGDVRLEGGSGPVLEVFIPPTENTARFAIDDDVLAFETLARVMGTGEPDHRKAGLYDDPETPDADESEAKGYYLVNEARGLKEHARAVAAEAMIQYADTLEGSVSTRGHAPSLAGTCTSASVSVDAAPSAVVTSTHTFTGQLPHVDRMAFLGSQGQYWVLGVIPYHG